MEKLNLTSAEANADNVIKNNETVEKSDFAKKVEGFDINNLSPENIEFMNHAIQGIFREHFPVDDELIDEIPDRMRIIDNDEFVRLCRETGEDADTDLGFYSLQLDQMLINVSRHHSPGTLFSTMFHESLHFASIRAGAGLRGGFCYPNLGENETTEFLDELDEGIRVIVEGTTENITRAYVIDCLGFDLQPQMLGYEPELQIMDAIWGPFSREERMQAYFNTPLELFRVRIESAFEKDYNPDKSNGVFVDCLFNIARTTRQMKAALKSWTKDGDPEPVEDVLNNVRRAVGLFVVRELEDGVRTLDEGDEEYLRDYLAPYLTKE